MKLKAKINDSPMLRVFITIGAFCATLISLGGVLIWFGSTTFAQIKQVRFLESRVETSERNLIISNGKTNIQMAVIEQKQDSMNEKLVELKNDQDEQKKLLWEILREVRR